VEDLKNPGQYRPIMVSQRKSGSHMNLSPSGHGNGPNGKKRVARPMDG